VARTPEDVDLLLDVEFDTGRAAVLQDRGLARLVAASGDEETIALFREVRTRIGRAKEQSSRLITRIRDREGKAKRRKR
jgi:hypothetical protein